MKLTKYIFILILLFTFASCSDDTDESSKKGNEGTRRTVVMYISAQNSLGYDCFHENDSAEIMAGSIFLNPRDQMIIYIDDATNPRIYRVYKSCKNPQLIKKYNKDLCSSDPEVLRDVLAYIKNKYKSESYGLVMWSHADGWLPSWNTNYEHKKRSFGIDVGPGGSMATDYDINLDYGTSMNIEDMAWAISESGMHPKYIFFDACLMQCIEVDYALRNVTDYVVAAPIATPAIGSNYTTMMREALFAENPEKIADVYYRYITMLPTSNIYYDFGMVISCVKTAELEKLAAETRKYIAKAKAYETDGKGNIVSWNYPNMDKVMQYLPYSASDFYRPHFFDLNAAMKNILSKEDHTAWKMQLDKCITYKGGTEKFFVNYDHVTGEELFLDVDLDNFCAVSAFIPQDIYNKKAEYCIFGNLNERFRETEWYQDAGWKDALW